MMRTFLFLFLGLTAGLAEATAGPGAVGEARQVIAEWVQTQRVLAEEKAAWREEREVLGQSIGLLEAEVDRLGKRLAELDEFGDQAEERRLSLAAENEALVAASAEADEWLGEIEGRLRELRSVFPPSLEARAAPLFANLAGVGEGRSRGVGQRLQTVLGLLAEVNAFQKSVTLARETRELSDGSRREVRTIYLGLAQAYFVDDQERVAGLGRPTAAGWQWTQENELAVTVGRAVAVLENRRSAEFINLPVDTK